MTTLLIGDGQLGSALLGKIAGPVAQAGLLGPLMMDLADAQAIRRVVREVAPSLIINAAAYTAVDKAETERDLCMAVNAVAPGVLAEEANALGVPLVHFSTDYVFDGEKGSPYVEEDVPRPLNVYGESKFLGERAIEAAGGAHLNLRTSWLYSGGPGNFYTTMLRLFEERDEVRVVADQVGAPTWVEDLATATVEVIERIDLSKHSGLYHLCARGETSWFGFAQAIQRNSGHRCVVSPIPSDEYPTPAMRPSYSVMSCERARDALGVELPTWESSVERLRDSLVGTGVAKESG